ncbi:MAG: hypothetical protein WCG85_11435 [Polyangia bacterium]
MLDGADSTDIAAANLANFSSRLEVALMADRTDLQLHWVSDDDRDTAMIRLCDFAKWALDMEQRSLDLWKELPQDFKVLAVEKPAPRWPWGKHTTELLGHLAEAGKYWEEKYDPAFPATAPTNKDIEDLLMARKWKEQRFPKRVAQVMAQILRADKVKAGPRNNS